MTKPLYTLGWDLGGAHVKAVLMNSAGIAVQAMQVPCPLWRGLNHLKAAVDAVMQALQHTPERHAVTMTGELVDIFPDRHAGVRQLSNWMFQQFGAEHVRVYAGSQGFAAQSQINTLTGNIASANWHASAAYLAHRVREGLLLDIGSTTSDLILLHEGVPCTVAETDAGRMASDELVYTGVIRTPVMAVVQRVPMNGTWQGVAAEYFATMADVYRLTGELSEVCDMAETADGAGKTLHESARRLARMVGWEWEEASLADWQQLAAAIRAQQLGQLREAIERQLSRGLLASDAVLLGAGAGRFLARELARLLNMAYQDVEAFVEAEEAARDWVVTCLPAYAVARLSRECNPWPR
jgi:probable H4MPT-linked C1 transfer pathway protein